MTVLFPRRTLDCVHLWHFRKRYQKFRSMYNAFNSTVPNSFQILLLRPSRFIHHHPLPCRLRVMVPSRKSTISSGFSRTCFPLRLSFAPIPFTPLDRKIRTATGWVENLRCWHDRPPYFSVAPKVYPATAVCFGMETSSSGVIQQCL